MKSRINALHIAARMCIAMIAALAATSALAVDDGEMTVPVHRSELISLPSALSEVIVADPNVADVYVHNSNNKISVVGKQVGTTNLRVLDKDGNVLRSLVVRVTYDLPAIRQSLYQFFPGENIAVQTVNNSLALTGVVSSAAVAEKAVRLANEFLQPVDAQQRPRGNAFSSPNADAYESDTGVINMLKVTSGQQVMLRVRVGEMQRNAAKQLGVSWDGIGNNVQFLSGGFVDSNVTDHLFDIGSGGTAGAAGGSFTSGSLSVTAMIDALESNNLFKILAEPNLVAMSGEEAEFLAGGEFPIPINENNSISIEYKEFGVAVRFLPQVISDSRIRITVKPEISELTNIGEVQLNGFTIPGISTRRAKTTVELAPGESFMIAGLLSDKVDSTIKQLPGLGEVPVLGALFRSTDFQRNESELVIAVTPYLVDPVSGDEIRMPTDNYRTPSFMQQVFYGALGSLSGSDLTVSQRPVLEGPIGFMVD